MTVGEELRQARQQAGLSQEQISQSTKIQVAKLEALEQNELERLPQGIYLDGIVRAYARTVGLDDEALVQRVRHDIALRASETVDDFAEEATVPANSIVYPIENSGYNDLDSFAPEADVAYDRAPLRLDVAHDRGPVTAEPANRAPVASDRPPLSRDTTSNRAPVSRDIASDPVVASREITPDRVPVSRDIASERAAASRASERAAASRDISSDRPPVSRDTTSDRVVPVTRDIPSDQAPDSRDTASYHPPVSREMAADRAAANRNLASDRVPIASDRVPVDVDDALSRDFDVVAPARHFDLDMVDVMPPLPSPRRSRIPFALAVVALLAASVAGGYWYESSRRSTTAQADDARETGAPSAPGTRGAPAVTGATSATGAPSAVDAPAAPGQPGESMTSGRRDATRTDRTPADARSADGVTADAVARRRENVASVPLEPAVPAERSAPGTTRPAPAAKAPREPAPAPAPPGVPAASSAPVARGGPDPPSGAPGAPGGAPIPPGGALVAPGAAPPASDVSGVWTMDTRVESSSYRDYEGLQLGYRVELQQDGARISGSGVKMVENGRRVGSTAQTPILVHGIISGERLTLTFTERGRRRTSEGKMILSVNDDGVLRGRFSSNAARSVGIVEARRPG